MRSLIGEGCPCSEAPVTEASADSAPLSSGSPSEPCAAVEAAPSPTDEGSSWHEPVMVVQVMEILEPRPDRVLVDATLGDGGHARAWLEKGGIVVGIDRDPVALARAAHRCGRWRDRLHVRHGRFSQLSSLLPSALSPDAVLLDLGTSWTQVETPGRGFSYTHDGPLDMRMDQSAGAPAAALLAAATAEELAALLQEFGDVPHARRLARAILRAGPPTTTGALAEVIERQVPRRLALKTLSCVFQALRMAVNDEWAELRNGLAAAVDVLPPGSRGVVLTYHSGEERAVRSFMGRESGRCSCPPGLPVCACHPHRRITITARGRHPDSFDVHRNARARSARLWAWERLDEP